MMNSELEGKRQKAKTQRKKYLWVIDMTHSGIITGTLEHGNNGALEYCQCLKYVDHKW